MKIIITPCKLFFPVFLLLIAASSFAQNTRYSKWLTPSFLRGYNILYESPKTLKDFMDFKNYGGNLFQIGTKGFMQEDFPYSIIEERINNTDTLVKFCRISGIYYTIAVRSGPGAYDVYEEAKGFTGQSRIWDSDNIKEQKLYAQMLKMIIEKYKDDSLFVGLNLIVEPRPKAFSIPANSSGLYKRFLEKIFGIHMDRVYEYLINEVRASDKYLPLIIENFAFSTPELFPSYKFSDPYIIYDAHLYIPYEFTHAEKSYSVSYPGNFKSITKMAPSYHDYRFMKETVLSRLRKFQTETGSPVFIGEFGIRLPQTGSSQYIYDVLKICLEYGWHFALWDWRRENNNGPDIPWNIETFTDKDRSTWNTLLGFFYPDSDLLKNK